MGEPTPGHPTAQESDPKLVAIAYINSIEDLNHELEYPKEKRNWSELYFEDVFMPSDVGPCIKLLRKHEELFSHVVANKIFSEAAITELLKEPVGHLRYIVGDHKTVLEKIVPLKSDQKVRVEKYVRLARKYLPSSKESISRLLASRELETEGVPTVPYQRPAANSQTYFEIEEKSPAGKEKVKDLLIGIMGLTSDNRPMFLAGDMKDVISQLYSDVMKVGLPDDDKVLLTRLKEDFETLPRDMEIYRNDTAMLRVGMTVEKLKAYVRQ